MKKTVYSTPQVKAVKTFAANGYMIEDWSAPDGGGGGGNEPEANSSFFDGDEKPSKSVWDD